MVRYEFRDGYVCHNNGFTKAELAAEIRKHGKLVSVRMED